MIADNFQGRVKRKQQLSQLLRQKRKLSGLLEKIDSRISQVESSKTHRSSPAAIERWLDDLSDGVPNLSPLPQNFSRADVYDDHD